MPFLTPTPNRFTHLPAIEIPVIYRYTWPQQVHHSTGLVSCLKCQSPNDVPEHVNLETKGQKIRLHKYQAFTTISPSCEIRNVSFSTYLSMLSKLTLWVLSNKATINISSIAAAFVLHLDDKEKLINLEIIVGNHKLQ